MIYQYLSDYLELNLPNIPVNTSPEDSYMTYDFNLDNDLDIKPIAKSEEHFRKWVVNYPFYANINRERVVLYGAA